MYRGQLKNINGINLDLTFRSGQIFRFKKISTYWIGIYKFSIVALKQEDKQISYKVEGIIKEDELINFLSLNDDFSSIFDEIPKDDVMYQIYIKNKGLALLKQDPWECLLSYLSTSLNNIKRINIILDRLAFMYGKELRMGNLRLSTYPAMEDFCKLNYDDFKSIGLGFRAKYYAYLVKKIKEGFDIYSLSNLETCNLKKQLQAIKGIGKKTADCICLYSFNRLECFPQDIWLSLIHI